MKALLLPRVGSLDDLIIAEAAMPEPGPGQVRVRVHAAGLNPVDYKLARSGHPAWQYPFVLGLDVAGVVDALGPDVAGWQPGDRVYYHGNLSRPGGFADYTLAAGHVMARIPGDVSFTDAAALPCAGFTAYQAVHGKLHVQAGQVVLVQGGAGGVGGFAVQLAGLAGAEVITTASLENTDYVRQLGARHVIDYNDEDVTRRVQALTGGRGVDAIVDTVGARTATAGLGMLAFGGGIACVAGLPDFAGFRSFARALSVHDIALGGAYFSGDRRAEEELARIGAAMIGLLRDERLDPTVSEIIPLEAIPDGLRRLAGRHVRGKIVARIYP